MKIALFSCFHGRFPDKIKLFLKENKPDAIFCCGDLCNVDSVRDIIFSNWDKKRKLRKIQRTEQYRKLLISSVNSMQHVLDELSELDVPIFFAKGNNDFAKTEVRRLKLNIKPLEERTRLNRKFKYLKNKALKFKNFQILGIDQPKHFSEDKEKDKQKFSRKLESLFSKIKDPNKAIVLMHYIPYGIFDIPEHGPRKGEHIGYKSILESLRKYQPLLYICGHMHEYQGLKYLNKTLIINTGAAQFGRFAILELDNEKGFKDVKFYQ